MRTARVSQTSEAELGNSVVLFSFRIGGVARHLLSPLRFMHTQIRSHFARFIILILCISGIGVFNRGGVLARAEDPSVVPVLSADASLPSAKPPVAIVPEATNTVSVQPADAESAEPLAGKENLGVFLIKRVGAIDFELPVFYTASGTAKNGVDYAKLAGIVTIPKGSASVEVVVKALGDLLVEEDETVVLTLDTPACLTLFPPPRTCYAVGTASVAKVVLKNSTMAPVNQPPKVVLTSPPEGEVRLTAGVLAIVAEATDPDGKVVSVEFFADNRSIGKKSEPLLGRYVIAWSNPSAGEHVLFAQATDDRGAASKSATVSIRVPKTVVPASSKLTVENPKSGASFQEPADISIDVTAVDPKGYISRVEFYSGETRLGVSEINFIRAPDAGTPIKHNFVWKQVKAGKYSIDARSTDSQKKAVRSDAVPVTVVAVPVVDQAVVSVVASDQEAGEDLVGDRRVINSAVFVVSRAGGKDIELPVYYSLSGTAENGKDYARLSGKVILSKGSKSAEIVVAPILDSLKEGLEYVVITVEPPVCVKIFPPPPECYLVGRENQAKAALADSQGTSKPIVPKSLLNINFGEGVTKKTKQGFAATGMKADDYWNAYVAPQKQSATLQRLKFADGKTSEISVTVNNAAGQGYNKTGDAMYDSYVYPKNTKGDGAGDIVAALKGMPAGAYDLFLYGKSEPSERGESDSFFTIKVGDSKRGPLTTIESSGWNARKPWVEGSQYVVFRGVELKLGQILEVFVSAGFNGKPADPLQRPAVLNGLQLASAVSVVPVDLPPKVVPSVATRVLPKPVVPGSNFVVRIKVVPAKGTMSYALQETPPQNWRVQSVPDNAKFDATSGTLRVGPFFDDVARTITYTLVPSSATGFFKFTGLVAVETTRLEIGGDNAAEYQFQFHPADSEPENQVVALVEVTSYGAAWKKGVKWAVGPNPIPAAYVTKAAAIWKGGGRYGIDGSLGDAPKWWVNVAEPVPTLDHLLEGSISLSDQSTGQTGGLVTIDNDSSGTFSVPNTARFIPDIGRHALSGAGSLSGTLPRVLSASAVRVLHSISGSVRVQIEVNPTSATSAYAVAEAIPAGWWVETVNSGGVVDAVNREVKWLFMDATARSLSYVIRPENAGASASSRLSGLISFDGEDAIIQGESELLGAGIVTTTPRLVSVQRTANGIVSLVLEGTSGVLVRVEGSKDLQTWSLVFEGGLTANQNVVIDESSEGSAMRFYRLKAE